MTDDEQKTKENGGTQKSKKGALSEFFLKPPLWFDIVVWVVAAVGIGFAVFVACLDSRGEIWAFGLYAVSLVLLIASLYLVLTFGDIPNRIARSKVVRRFVSDFGFRSYAACICSAAAHALYTVFGTAIAVLTHSSWLGALVWYHMVLALCGSFVVFYVKRRSGSGDVERTKIRAYILGGGALIVIAVAIIPVILLVVLQKNSYTFFGGALVYVCTLALYTVIKLVASVVNRRRAHKSGDMSLKAVRNISFASALISVFALQATMLVAMEDVALAAKLNPVTGSAVSFCIAVMGAVMIIGGIAALKRKCAVGADDAERDAENSEKQDGDAE